MIFHRENEIPLYPSFAETYQSVDLIVGVGLVFYGIMALSFVKALVDGIICETVVNQGPDRDLEL